MSLAILCRRAAVCLAALAIPGCAAAPPDRRDFVETGTRSLPLGVSLDGLREVYGLAEGYEGGGHGPSFAYKDERGKGCLIVDTQDRRVETLILREARRAPPQSATVSLREGDLRTSRGLSLGDPPEKVERILGRPHEVRREGNRLTYAWHASSDESPRVGCCYDGVYAFEDGRLVEIRLHDGC